MLSDYRFSVAISFAGDNKRSIVRSVATILRDKLGDGRVFFDEWFEAELAGHDANIVLQTIYQKSSYLVVTCVCQSYNEKPWPQDEWRAIQSFERTLRDAGSENKKRLRFLPLRFGDGNVDGLFDTAIVPDVRERSPAQIAELILQRLKLSGNTDVYQAPSSYVEAPDESTVNVEVLPAPARLPAQHRMPYPSLGTRFTGRVKPLIDLHELLRDGIAVVEGVGVVVGTGGLGKTQLAIEYVHRYGAQYKGGVFWVDADQSYNSAIGQLANAVGIDVDATLPAEKHAELLWHEIAKNPESTLIVYDNFPEDEQFQRWRPTNTAQIKTLVTTRCKGLSASRVTLKFMHEEESLAMLNSRERKFSAEEVDPLLALLGGLPLALELSSNYLNLRSDISIDELVEEMLRIGDVAALDAFSKKYRDELPSGHEKSITATFQISWDQASVNGRNILALMACWGAAPTPRRILHRALDDEPTSLLDDPVEEAIAELVQLSLVELDDDNDPYMHRLLRDFVREMAYTEIVKSKALSTIKEEFARSVDDDDISAWEELEKVIPHAHGVIAELTGIDQDVTGLRRYLAWYELAKGRYLASRSVAEHTLSEAVKHYEPGNIAIAIAQSDMALVSFRMGENKDAMSYFKQALPIMMKEPHSGLHVITAFGNAANVLRELGKLEEAKGLLEKILMAKQIVYRSEHLEVARAQANLAIVLKDLEDLPTARILHEQALATMKSHYPSSHVQVAMTQANLAEVLRQSDELKGARDLLEQSLDGMQKNYPPGHLEIAKVQENLARVQQDLANWEDVRDLMKESLAARREHMPPGDLVIANNLALLALAHMQLGEPKKARTLYAQSLATKRQHYPSGHIEIASTIINYGTVLLCLNEFKDARDLLEEGLASERRHYPPGHPEIASTQTHLAIAQNALGETSMAQDLLKQVLKSAKMNHPPGHPAIQTAERNLSSLVNVKK